MKIAIDISQIAYRGTGVSNYTRELVLNLINMDAVNDYILFAVTLANRKIYQDFFENQLISKPNVNLKFIPLPEKIANPLWNSWHIIRLEKFIDRVDIYHSSDWIQIPSLAKKVTTVHDLVVFRYPQTLDSYIVHTQRKRMHWVKSECDLIIADSLSTRQDLRSFLKIDERKIEVVYPGVREVFRKTLNKNAAKILEKFGINNDYIISVGKREPRKNLKLTVLAFSRFLKQLSRSRIKSRPDLVIVGKWGWGEKISGSEHIRVIDSIDDNDLARLYSQAQFLLYPSLYEGFGLPVLEAMECGCPVICSNRGSLKEVGGSAALFVNPESLGDLVEKISNLYLNKKLRSELITKGKKQAAKFSWKKSAERIIELYQRVYRE